MSVIQLTRTKEPHTKKPRIIRQYFKGKINGDDFTATTFQVSVTDGRWHIIAKNTDNISKVTHTIMIVLPDTVSKRIYKLQDEDEKDFRITYSTDSLTDPILAYGGKGLIDLLTVDLDNRHIEGALVDITTRNDGNPVFGIAARFSLG